MLGSYSLLGVEVGIAGYVAGYEYVVVCVASQEEISGDGSIFLKGDALTQELGVGLGAHSQNDEISLDYCTILESYALDGAVSVDRDNLGVDYKVNAFLLREKSHGTSNLGSKTSGVGFRPSSHYLYGDSFLSHHLDSTGSFGTNETSSNNYNMLGRGSSFSQLLSISVAMHGKNIAKVDSGDGRGSGGDSTSNEEFRVRETAPVGEGDSFGRRVDISNSGAGSDLDSESIHILLAPEKDIVDFDTPNILCDDSSIIRKEIFLRKHHDFSSETSLTKSVSSTGGGDAASDDHKSLLIVGISSNSRNRLSHGQSLRNVDDYLAIYNRYFVGRDTVHHGAVLREAVSY